MAKWTKGQSGNPGGRPKALGDIREIARKHTREAIKTLVTVMQTPKATDQARVHAATALLDRAWGRPAQTIRASVERDTDVDERLAGSAAELIRSIRATGGIENNAALATQPESRQETAPIVATESEAPACVTH